MKIESITYNGIGEVYKTFQEMSFGAKSANFFNHVAVFIHISELTMIEAFYMKQFVGGQMTDIGATQIDDDDFERLFPEETFPDMKPAITSITGIFPEVDRDENVPVKPGYSILPLGTIKREVVVRFTGNGLMLFFDKDFRVIWNTIFTRTDDNGESHIIPLTERPAELDLHDKEIAQNLDNYMIQAFITKFYQYLDNSLTTQDQRVDAYIYDNYYKYLQGANDCTLSDIHTPVRSVRFFDNENALKEIDSARELIQLAGPQMRRGMSDGIRMNFSVISSIYTLIELMLILPYGSIVDYGDININLNTDKIAISRSMERYRSRIINKVKIMNAIKCELAKMDIMPIAKYNFIIGSSPIRYNIMITGTTFKEFENILYDVDQGYYGPKNTLLYRELHLILDNIVKMTNSMRALLFSK